MTVQKTTPKNYRKLLATAQINIESDTFKVALMNDSFVFDRDTHSYWDDVSTYEIAHQNGYLQPYILSNPVITNLITYSANFGDIMIVPDGGIIPLSSAIIYDDTATDKPIIAFLLFSQYKELSVPYLIKNIIISIGD